MKKKEIRVLAIAGLMSALLFGCGSGGGTPETPPEPVTGTEKEITVKKDNTLMEETRPGFHRESRSRNQKQENRFLHCRTSLSEPMESSSRNIRFINWRLWLNRNCPGKKRQYL